MRSPSSGPRPPHTIVVGLQYGDEGKGQFVDLFAAEHDVVVRFNGGANAGHTVEAGGERFKFHLLPSGILAPQILNVIGNGVALDPTALIGEIDALMARDAGVGERLRISDRAHVVLPYHRVEESLLEASALRFGGAEAMIGTTGRGIGPTYADKALRITAIRVGDLLNAAKLRSQLNISVAVKNAMLSGLAALLATPFEPFDVENLVSAYTAAGERLRPFITDTRRLLRERDAAGSRILFEGAHSAMLDVDHGTYPYVTSSGCTPLAAAAGSGVPLSGRARVVGVVKAYTSRVGAGPFPTELHGDIAERLRKAGAEYGTSTGRPRRIGWLDLADVGETAALCGVDMLALTGILPLSIMETIGIGDSGANVTEASGWAAWADSIGACREYKELPQSIRHFVDRIDAVRPVGWVSVGRSREAILTRSM